MYFPKGSQHLNAVEECWHQGKRILLVSEYYRIFSDMRSAVSMCYQTARFSLELRHDLQLKIKSFSSNSYTGVFSK